MTDRSSVGVAYTGWSVVVESARYYFRENSSSSPRLSAAERLVKRGPILNFVWSLEQQQNQNGSLPSQE